jgi:hypothetical protein
MCTDDLGAFGLVGEEVIDFRDGAVEDGHFEAMVIHVEDEVLTHYGEADEADVTGGVWHDELRKRGGPLAFCAFGEG